MRAWPERGALDGEAALVSQPNCVPNSEMKVVRDRAGDVAIGDVIVPRSKPVSIFYVRSSQALC